MSEAQNEPGSPEQQEEGGSPLEQALEAFRANVLAPVVKRLDELAGRIQQLEQTPAPDETEAPLSVEEAQAELESPSGPSLTNPNPPSV